MRVTSVGLVLGAGGMTGHAFHAGTLAALADATGWDPRRAEVVVGTSAGAGVGAVLRAGLPAHDVLARAEGRPMSPDGLALMAGMERPASVPEFRPAPRWWVPASPGLVARELLRPWRLRPGNVLAGALPAGHVPTEPIGARLRRLWGDRWPASPLWLCAVRLSDGARVVFGRGPSPRTDVGTAVEASSAIPGFFAPVDVDGVRYVDGGAHSPTNADLLARSGFDLVIVSSPMSARPEALAGSLRAMPRALHHEVLRRELAGLARGGTKVLAFEPSAAELAVMGWNAMDPGRMPAVAEQAYRSARALLDTAAARDARAVLAGG